MKKLKIFLCGYQRAGRRVLEHLLQRNDIAEIAVFTHEAPAAAADVHALAMERNIWSTKESLRRAPWPFEPDVISSVYYRHIIPQDIIDRVGGKIFNLHSSLLPRHRGCSSLTWALVEGESLAGITYHYIDAGVDTGNILLQAALQIGPHETQADLYERAMDLGAAFWPAAFELVKSEFPGVPQEGESSCHKRGAPHDGIIDDSWDLERVERFIRAMTNPPLPYATYRGQEVRTMDQFLRLKQALPDQKGS
jgi:methionyl-tRNA formyltransferase